MSETAPGSLIKSWEVIFMYTGLPSLSLVETTKPTTGVMVRMSFGDSAGGFYFYNLFLEFAPSNISNIP
jgi:hypothetical protein